MEPTGTLICFPYDFSDTSPSPLLASPGFLLLVADSTPQARAATRSALPWPRKVALSDGSPPAATSNSGVFHQPTACFHQPLLQARQRPVSDPVRQQQP